MPRLRHAGEVSRALVLAQGQPRLPIFVFQSIIGSLAGTGLAKGGLLPSCVSFL